ncbi:MAG: hypothetical protein JST76_13820 [Bacteroidetes bacterium]|nr:hypothetical protein [Bacteroidota bacterium]
MNFSIFFIFCFSALLVLLIYYIFGGSVENHERWQHSFDFEFSSDEFYTSVQEAITERKIPGVKFTRVKYSQGNIFSGSREYLHIAKDDFMFDICAAPYGTGFFVSMWYAENYGILKQMANKIPLVKAFMERRSYYQIYTEAMAKAAIHVGFNAAIEALVTSKGARALGKIEMGAYKLD